MTLWTGEEPDLTGTNRQYPDYMSEEWGKPTMIFTEIPQKEEQ
jgi:hypothetical protein